MFSRVFATCRCFLGSFGPCLGLTAYQRVLPSCAAGQQSTPCQKQITSNFKFGFKWSFWEWLIFLGAGVLALKLSVVPAWQCKGSHKEAAQKQLMPAQKTQTSSKNFKQKLKAYLLKFF